MLLSAFKGLSRLCATISPTPIHKYIVHLLLKQQRQELKAWTVNIIFVAFNWSRLYISIVHHLLVGTITHPCITNLFASAICICCHCENTIKLIFADQFPWVKNISETEWSEYIGKCYKQKWFKESTDRLNLLWHSGHRVTGSWHFAEI